MTTRRPFLEPPAPGELVLIGAEDARGLQAATERLSTFVAAAPSASLADIALTSGLAARRSNLVAAVVAESLEDLARKLFTLDAQLKSDTRVSIARRDIYLPVASAGEGGRLAFVFPGEGSQYPHMLGNICMSIPECLSAFDEADAASIAAGGMAPSQWIFPTGKPSGDTRAPSIGIADGAMAVLSADTAFMRLLSHLDLRADGAVGLGMGEIAALEYAGVCSFNDSRSRLAALAEGYTALRETSSAFDASKTNQISVSGVAADLIGAIIERFSGNVQRSRILAPDKFSLCVKSESAQALSHALAEVGGIVRQLPFNRPFHTTWFDKAAPALAGHFANWFVRPPSIPIYSCVDGNPLPDDIASLRSATLAQWSHPVDFVSAIRHMADDGFRLFVEVGARGSLSTCIDELLGNQPHLAVPMNRVHRGGLQQVHNALAALAAHGVRFDVSPFHVHRGSRIVDLSKPVSPKHSHQPRRHRIDTALPSLGIDSLPAELLNLIPRAPAQSQEAPRTTGSQPKADSSFADAHHGTDLPMLLQSRIIGETPGESIMIRQALTCADFPFLDDCALCAQGVSIADPLRHGLLVMPLAFCAELLAEAACRLVPDHFVTRAENLHVIRWITLETARRVVRIKATLSETQDVADAVRVDAAILDGSGDDGSCDSPLARASFILTKFHAAVAEPTEMTLANARDVDLDAEALNRDFLLSEPRKCALRTVTRIADDGIEGIVRPLGTGEIVRGVANPSFALAPRMVAAIEVAAIALESSSGIGNPFPLCKAIRRIDFIGGPVDELGDLRLRIVKCQSQGKDIGVFRAIVTDSSGRAIASFQGYEMRLFELPGSLNRALRSPVECLLSHPLPDGVLPSLPQDVFCRVADGLPAELLDDPQALWLKAEAAMVLSANELVHWRYNGGTISRRHEWLMGRIAAKDAVRSCLRERYGRKWAAADVMIETDDAGKPIPQGPWRRHCGAMMDVSITHNPDLVVAVAAPNAHVGLDIERCNRRLTDAFIDGAFRAEEQEIAAESGEGAIALMRFWCAKEALSKALGTGLRYGTSDLLVRSYDISAGRIELELTGLWCEVFPDLKGKLLTVHTGLLGDCILSLCVL